MVAGFDFRESGAGAKARVARPSGRVDLAIGWI